MNDDELYAREQAMFAQQDQERALSAREQAMFAQQDADRAMTDESAMEAEAEAENAAFVRGYANARGVKPPSPKQIEKSFRQQVNNTAAKGDSGGAGAKMRAKTPTNIPANVTIESGDTLWGIAKRYGMNLNDLQSLNEGVDPRKLQIGQQIRLREMEPAPESANEPVRDSGMREKIQASLARRPSAFDVLGEVNPDNGYNQGIQSARDTAMNYVGSVAGGVAGAGRTAGASALKQLFTPAKRPRVIHDSVKIAEEMFRPVIRQPRGKF